LTDVDGWSILHPSTLVNIKEEPMSRVQLALNVADIDSAVQFYSTLFGVEPAKRRPGYANFVVESPALKLVLIETAEARTDGVSGALNHLGIEVDTPEEVQAATKRLADGGLTPDVQESTTCCYAVQDKAWVHDPDGAPWEVYTVVADASDQASLGCSTQGCLPMDLTVPVGIGSGTASVGSCC
jgi:catechol 2,3-dioxygenase-like lactoylglutathione lyase family enzyme